MYKTQNIQQRSGCFLDNLMLNSYVLYLHVICAHSSETQSPVTVAVCRVSAWSLSPMGLLWWLIGLLISTLPEHLACRLLTWTRYQTELSGASVLSFMHFLCFCGIFGPVPSVLSIPPSTPCSVSLSAARPCSLPVPSCTSDLVISSVCI